MMRIKVTGGAFGSFHLWGFEAMKLPKTLTEAQALGQVRVVRGNANRSQSARQIPYEETYRNASGLMEPPAELLQRVVDEEGKKRR